MLRLKGRRYMFCRRFLPNTPSATTVYLEQSLWQAVSGPICRVRAWARRLMRMQKGYLGRRPRKCFQRLALIDLIADFMCKVPSHENECKKLFIVFKNIGRLREEMDHNVYNTT